MNASSKFGQRLAGNTRSRPGQWSNTRWRFIVSTHHGPTLPLSTAAAPSSVCLPNTYIDKQPHCCHTQTRAFASSSASNNNSPKDYSKVIRLEDANPERIRGIHVNPNSLGYSILPGNLIYKKYNWSGNTRKVPVELVHGYFWMLWDLKNTQQKPTLSNDTLIPSDEAQMFPTLNGLNTLSDPTTKVNLPAFFWNRSLPSGTGGGAAATLVAISFRESGFKMIPSWTEPLERAFPATHRGAEAAAGPTAAIQIYKLSITERWVLYPLRNLLTKVMKQNTADPVEQANTLVYFGTKDVDDFRDVLRMHNIMTAYVFLLDGKGRVRFAGSGEATAEDVQRLVGFTKELMVEAESGTRKNQQLTTKQKKGRR